MSTKRGGLKQIISLATKAEREVKFCWTTGCSNTDYVWSHVISERAQLQIYDGKCYTLESRYDPNEHEHMDFKLVSTKSALVTRSFCKMCDENIFRDLDVDFLLTKKTAKLQAYRALAMKEFINRKNYYFLDEGVRLGLLPSPTNLRSMRGYSNISDERQFYSLSIEKLKSRLLSEDHLHSVRLDLSRDPGFRCSVATTIQLDFYGNRILGASAHGLPQIYISLLSDKGGPFLLLTTDVEHRKLADLIVDQLAHEESSRLEALLVSYFIFNPAGLTLPRQLIHEISALSKESIIRAVKRQKSGEYVGNMELKRELLPFVMGKLARTSNPLEISSIRIL